MKEHIRLSVLKHICELLESELGIKVYRGRQVVGKDIPTPFLVINETIRSGDTAQTFGKMARNDRVDCLLVGYVDADSVSHPIDVSYDFIGKIEQAFSKIFELNGSGNSVYPEHYLLGKKVSDFEYQSPVAHNPHDDVQSKSYFYFYFSFWVAYKSNDPFREV